MEYGSIAREMHVDASPEVAFTVVSSPEHIAQWWTDDASFEVRSGAVGEFVFGDRVDVFTMKVERVEAPRLFAFRWCYPGADAEAESLLVTFELTPEGAGTRIRLVETGFREMGWEAAKLEEVYQSHVEGWDLHFPDLGKYLARLVAAR